MTVVKFDLEALALRKADGDLLDVSHRDCLRIVLGIRLTDRISNSRLYEICGSIPLFRAIMRERLRWLGNILRMKDGRLPKIVLFGQPSRAKQKGSLRRLRWEDVINKDLKEMGASWEGLQREAKTEKVQRVGQRVQKEGEEIAWFCGELLAVLIITNILIKSSRLLQTSLPARTCYGFSQFFMWRCSCGITQGLFSACSDFYEIISMEGGISGAIKKLIRD